MLQASFSFKIGHEIQPQLVTLGRYDGVSPSLTCATTAGKVFVHCPSRRRKGEPDHQARTNNDDGSNVEIRFLSMNKKLTALKAGPLVPGSPDVLAVGSPTDFQVYDVEQNKDIFYKEMPDGAHAIVIGAAVNDGPPLAYVGGNCSILGFDANGDDQFWTVTGDNVTALAIVNNGGGTESELVVGSEDFDIRLFKPDAEMTNEFNEDEAITALCSLGKRKFGFALANGAIGVYEGGKRLWCKKMKNQPISLHAFDMTSNGILDLVTGWSDGRVDVRNMITGDVLFNDRMDAAIAGIVDGDYQMSGQSNLIVCSVDGEVRGYTPIGRNLPDGDVDPIASPQVTRSRRKDHDDTLRNLSQRKQDILTELSHYEKSVGKHSKGKDSGSATASKNANISTKFEVIHGDDIQPHVLLRVALDEESARRVCIRSVIIFAESLFNGESFVAHPPPAEVGSTVTAPLYPTKRQPVNLKLKILIGSKGGVQFYVHELLVVLPRFSLFTVPHIGCAEPKGSVTLPLSASYVNEVTVWIAQNFLLDSPSNEKDVLACVSLINHQTLRMQLNNDKLVIQTDDSELAGDVINSLFEHLRIDNVTAMADFPQEEVALQEVLVKVEEFHAVRQKLSAEMADHGMLIKSLAVRAEDARLMSHFNGMQDAYQSLYDLNKDLINAYNIRCSNHMELLSCLKVVNQHIQRSGRLRVGTPKSQIVSACRLAIKNNDIPSLFRIMRNGPPQT